MLDHGGWPLLAAWCEDFVGLQVILCGQRRVGTRSEGEGGWCFFDGAHFGMSIGPLPNYKVPEALLRFRAPPVFQRCCS